MLLRTIGYLFLCVATAALAYDGMRVIADDGYLVFTSAYQHWSTLSPSSLAETQKWIESMSTYLWSPVLMTVLLLPAWFVLAGIGSLFYVAGYQPPRPTLSDGI